MGKRKKYVYKVWIEIERYNEETGESDELYDAGLPFASEATFKTSQAAERYAQQLHGISQNITLVEE
jgi:hypothetical protein